MNPYVKRQTANGSMIDYLVVEGLLIRPRDGADALVSDNTGGMVSASASGGIGYGTGAGGAVTQGTNITTGVTLNTVCGTITTVAAGAVAGAEDGPFTVTNSAVAATDVVLVSIKSYAGAGTPFAFVSATGAGSFAITITNLHGANALNAAIVLNFAVIKGVAA